MRSISAALGISAARRDSFFATNALMLGTCFAQLRQPDSARRYFGEAADVRGEVYGRRSVKYAEAAVAVANLALARRDYVVAEPIFLEQKNMLEQIGQRVSMPYASCCNGLCNVYLQQGDLERAEPLAVSTLEIRGKLFPHTHPSYAVSCRALANLYIAIRQYRKAEPLYLELVSIYENAYTKRSRTYVENLVGLADLYYRMRRFAESEERYGEAMSLIEGAVKMDSATCGLVYNNFANLSIAMGRWAQAKELEEKARVYHGEELGTMGVAEMGLGDNAAAVEDLTKAGDQWKKYLAQAYWRMGRIGEARALFVEAVRAKVGQMRRVFQFMSDEEKADYMKSVLGVEEELYTLIWDGEADSAGDAYDIILADRNMILTTSSQVRDLVNRSGDSALLAVYREWMTEKRVLARMYADAASEQQIKAAEDKADISEKQMTKGAEKLVSVLRKTPLGWREIRAKLGGDEAAVEFISFPYFDGLRFFKDSVLYAALVLRKDRAQPVWVRLCGEDGLDSLLNAGRQNDVVVRGAATMSAVAGGAAQRLYQLVWRPLEKELGGVKTVYYSPAGALFRISFTSLPIGGDSVLSDRYRLEQVSQTSDVVTAGGAAEGGGRLKAGDQIWLYGGVDYKGGPGTGVWASLPGTRVETDRIREYGAVRGMRVTMLSGAQATEESVKALDGKGYPAVLHLATHGFCYPVLDTTHADVGPGAAFIKATDPLMRSGIVLSGGNLGWNGMAASGTDDGILTAYEVSNLYLPSVRLVVLSACETALGEVQGTEGVYGLARAFRMAGVQNLVMSLWTVPDGPTAEFMGVLYHHLFDGESVSAAFRAAQEEMKKKYRKEPGKWAAWILVR